MIGQVLYALGSLMFGGFIVTVGVLAVGASQRRRGR